MNCGGGPAFGPTAKVNAPCTGWPSTEIARRSPLELEEFRRLPFTEVCFRVVRPFATPDVPEEVLWQIVAEAINFPVKLVSLSPGLHILELFHGPTLAFKDFGARFMARLMGYFVRGETRLLTVLVATSGDTGSAVAHGFLGVPGIRCCAATVIATRFIARIAVSAGHFGTRQSRCHRILAHNFEAEPSLNLVSITSVRDVLS